ncbi:hypothetical protein SSX86_027967 [Deinandra increscens subsp. villosa]|uniref:F-box domain-containing protein n=1 Tax=Deinandra increscens subsp. villosa TaxID=3103831 RepID=A0AAP0C7T7_9ASTR
MMNTGPKLKKLKPCLLNTSMEDTHLQSTTHSGALIGSNDDLLTEILLRLPATSIIRFKSVSKHWRLLLSDRTFTLRYDNLSKSPGVFFHNIYVPYDVKNQSTPPFCSFDFCNDPHGIKIVQSCNGLLLCSSDKGGRRVRRYYVLNPTTKNFQIIPVVLGGEAVCKTEAVRKSICFMGLAFHPTDCVRYKIVCVRRLKRGGKLFQIQIYSSGTGKWKISVKSFLADYRSFITGVYWNGAIYWAPSLNTCMFFDIVVEKLQTLASPEKSTDSSSILWTEYLGESRGHLHLIVIKYHREYKISFVNVYEMSSDRSGWFVKYRVERDEIRRGISYSRFTFLDVVRGVKEEDTFMVLHNIHGKLIKYNVYDKSFKEIFNRNLYKRYSNNVDDKSFKQIYSGSLTTGYLYYHRYTESLASF